jgi:superfamily II DNA or RNA helicase
LNDFSPEQLRGLADAMAGFPSIMRARGREYAVQARVGPLLFLPEAVGARVRGTRLYEVWWTWDDEVWVSTCTCPIGMECKHQYAVACCVLDPMRDAPTYERRLSRLLPDRPVVHARLGQPDPRGHSRALASRPMDDDETSEEAPSPVTPVRPRRRDFRPAPWSSIGMAGPNEEPRQRAGGLAQLRAARDAWSRATALERLLMQEFRASVPVFRSPFNEILSGSDFDVMCWHLTRVLPEWTGGLIPAALEPYLDRPDLQVRYVSSMRQALAERLATWSTERTRAPERSLRFVLGLERVASGPATLTVDPRLTSRKLRDEPRTLGQLQHLLRETQRHPGHLLPVQVALLEAYVTSLSDWAPNYPNAEEGITTTTVRRLLEAGAGTPALVWDENLDPDLASRYGITPDEPVRLGARTVAVTPVCEAGVGGLALRLQVSWPDGRSRDFDSALLMSGRPEGARRHPSLVVCEGEIHVVGEQPPPEITQLFLAAEGLPLDRKRHAPMLEQMVERFPALRESLAPYTRVHPAAPVVAIDVREDDWMQIRLFAAVAETGWRPLEPVVRGARVMEFAPEAGWSDFSPATRGRGGAPAFEPTASAAAPSEPADAPVDTTEAASSDAAPEETPDAAQASAEQVWIERMDDSLIAPARDWLARTGAQDGSKSGPGGLLPPHADGHIGWWLRLAPRRMATFAGAWDERPVGVRWFCTPRAKRMLGEVHAVRPKLHVASSGVDWFSVSAEWEAEGLMLTDEDLAALRRASGPYVKISSGWVRREAGELVDEAAETLSELGIEPGAGPQRLSVWQLAQARPEALAAFEALGADPAAAGAIRTLRRKVAEFKGLPRVEVPAGFHGTLRPYQQEGVDFLAYASSLGLGAVLADDMGLGKTVQALVWLLWLRERTPDLGPALVVCPASVVHNWAREAEKFAPALRVALLTSGTRRHALLAEAESHDLLVTNYALLRRDLESWRKVPLGVAILDEAQNVKNPDAAVSRAALALGARHRLALTGTPLENRALDLWSIMTFVNPGLLGPRSVFAARFDRPDAPAHTRRLLAARLRPALLRRMKQQVAKDLPERIEERRDCEMHPAQRRLYLAELTRSRELLQGLAAGPEGLAQHRIEILAALTRLRQICCHPALTGAGPAAGSGKFDALWEILEPLLEEGHKVLVFSQFVRCLDLLEKEMESRGIAYHVLTGQTQTKKREEVVERFQSDERPGVFLVSLKAGGTGLNLTAASYVVLFDPWWNPAVEAQAIDRTHRIGQTRTVIAYRLLTRGTLEEKIWELQQRKAALARDILGEDGFARTLTRADLEYLLATE